KDGIPRAFDCNLDAPTYLFERGDDRRPVTDKPLAPALPRLLTWSPLDIQTIQLPATASSPGVRPYVLENHLKAVDRQIDNARQDVMQARKAMIANTDAKSTNRLELSLEAAERALAAAELQSNVLRARVA